MGIKPVLSAPRSPWQRAYVERVIGTIRRERLDHVIVLNEASLYRHVKSFVAYYHESRTLLSRAKDAPESRPVQSPELGRIAAIPQAGGLHHRYERRAAREPRLRRGSWARAGSVFNFRHQTPSCPTAASLDRQNPFSDNSTSSV